MAEMKEINEVVKELLNKEKALRTLATRIQKEYTEEIGIFVADPNTLNRVRDETLDHLGELKKHVKFIRRNASRLGDVHEIYNTATRILHTIGFMEFKLQSDLHEYEYPKEYFRLMEELDESAERMEKDVEKLVEMLR